MTVIELREAEVTLTIVDPVTAPEPAEIVAEPAAIALTRRVADTVANEGAEELHAVVLVTSFVLPSL